MSSYTEDVATLLRGFEEGVFVRNTSKDAEPGWAIKLLPYLAAMGRLAKGEYPQDGPDCRKLIEEHNRGCLAACGKTTTYPHTRKSRNCDARRDCPDCPKDWMIDLPSVAKP